MKHVYICYIKGIQLTKLQGHGRQHQGKGQGLNILVDG